MDVKGRFLAAVGLLASIHLGAQSARAPQTLGVAGSANATPSLAAADRTVASVWTSAHDGQTNVYAAISTDGGTTFSSPVRVNDREGDAGATNEQPPRVVITGSRQARIITVLWSKRDTGPANTRRDVMRVSRSTDGGRTFSAARLTHDAAFSGARGWQSLAAAPDGTIHMVWLDGREADARVAAAARGGTPHRGQPPQEIFHGTIGPDGRVSETRIASDVCFCCKTAVAADSRGTVYTAWRHIFPGSMRDIAFAKSADQGRRFGAIVKVSDDRWELNGCPEDGPSLAVDPSGRIHIAWATVVGDGEPQKVIFYSTSRDGLTFSARQRVPTDASVTPGHPHLTLAAGGGAAIAFDEAASGVRRVSLVRISATGVIQPPQPVSGGAELASHPVVVQVPSGEYLVAWTSRPAATSSEPSRIGLRRLR